MYFGLSDDQIFFQDNVKKFLEDNAPLDVIKKIASNEDKLSKDDLPDPDGPTKATRSPCLIFKLRLLNKLMFPLICL